MTSADNQSSMISRMIDGTIRFSLDNKLIVAILLIAVLGWGVVVMPFDYEISQLPRDPVPVDAIPDIGENQQIVFTVWQGRSPQDVEDQVTYPLTRAMLGVPGVKSVRSHSTLGFSSVYVVFNEDVEFYWSRSRILERLNVAQRDLPEGAVPSLGPDATALGQVYWYTLEGRDPATNKPVGGWDLDEIRSVQDWYVRYALQSSEGVAEVASIGGFVREYQVDVDPSAMRSHNVTLMEVYDAVRKSNIDVGARTIEVNRVEYVVRGLGFLKDVKDIEDTVVKTRNNIPIKISHVAHVSLGPAQRRGALDKGGSEAVGGVVVVRYGENPMEVIKNVKQKIEEVSNGLPSKRLEDGTISKLTIVPFYDRTHLIQETLGTLEHALSEEIMVTMIVVIVMVMHLRSSLLISSLLPLAVIMSFICMKIFKIDSNIMSLSGIAIAIGTMVDMGVILCENIMKHLDEADKEEDRGEVIFRATSEVGRPVLTAILTTVISFLPVFVMIGAEGKLFKPLAFTKTFALVSSVVVALTVIPPMAHILLSFHGSRSFWRSVRNGAVVGAGVIAVIISLVSTWPLFWCGWLLVGIGVAPFVFDYLPKRFTQWSSRLGNVAAVAIVFTLLTSHWMPLGVDAGWLKNFLTIAVGIMSLLAIFGIFSLLYEPLLRSFLRYKLAFYMMPVLSATLGLMMWLGFSATFSFIPTLGSQVGISEKSFHNNSFWKSASKAFPGLDREFMPPLDEGSFLYMPTTMPHASIGEALDVLSKQDVAIQQIPEIESVVGKIGRVDSPLDPAPISMVETIVNYKPEYGPPDTKTGKRTRLWRPHIKTPDDIWDEIEKAARVPGSTSAPKLQPIATRLVMLQTGVRAPMAVRIRGQNLADIEQVGMTIERLLKEVPGVEPSTVFADRIVGKPYLEIEIHRDAIARFGVNILDVQRVIETAVGGRKITTTVEGRERYPVRVRYPRELRDTIESIERVLVPSGDQTQVPLKQLATLHYVRGPQVIKSEDSRYVGYVIFDKKPNFGEVDVVVACQNLLKRKISEAEQRHQQEGVSWEPRDDELFLPAGTELPTFIGSYENQVRSSKTLALIIPLAVALIFIVLYLQFRRVSTTLLVIAGVVIAWSGGMQLLWLYGQDWFLDVSIFDIHFRELFQIKPYNLSVAVWVGFIALLGIATDDGVVVASYLDQSFAKIDPQNIEEIREATVQAGKRRIRPCLMTTATTILALIPILTSSGRGSDVMIPMAIPSFGGMAIELMTLFFVPVSYCWIRELNFKFRG